MKYFYSRLSNREKLFFCVTVAIIGYFIIMNFVIQPYVLIVKDLENKIEAKEIQLIKYGKLVKFKDTASNIIESLSSTQGKSAAMGMPNFLKEIESLARKSGIQLQDMQPSPVEEKDLYRKYEVDLQAECVMSQLTNFLYLLQSSREPVMVRQFRLVAFDEKGESKLKAYFDITRYEVASPGQKLSVNN